MKVASLVHILLLSWRDSAHPEGGGSERYLESLAIGLIKAGHRVTLMTAQYAGSQKEEYWSQIRFLRRGGRCTVYVWALRDLFLARFRLGPLGKDRPDVIVDTQNGVPFGAVIAGLAPVILLVHHIHREQWPVVGAVLGKIGWWIESVLSPYMHRHTRCVTVSTPSMTDMIRVGFSAENLSVVHAGADYCASFCECAGSDSNNQGLALDSLILTDAAPSTEPTLISVARLVPHKNLEDTLMTVQKLVTIFPTLVCHIVGEGWWRARLEKQIQALGVEKHVIVHGWVDESTKHQLLSQSWVHLMPSRKEGWGLTVLEAARHEVPTVGYAHSEGLQDSVIDGTTGYLVHTQKELCDAVEKLLLSAPLRSRLGSQAREWSDSFSWSQTTQQFLEIIVQVLKKSHKGRLDLRVSASSTGHQ